MLIERSDVMVKGAVGEVNSRANLSSPAGNHAVPPLALDAYSAVGGTVKRETFGPLPPSPPATFSAAVALAENHESAEERWEHFVQSGLDAAGVAHMRGRLDGAARDLRAWFWAIGRDRAVYHGGRLLLGAAASLAQALGVQEPALRGQAERALGAVLGMTRNCHRHWKNAKGVEKETRKYAGYEAGKYAQSIGERLEQLLSRTPKTHRPTVFERALVALEAAVSAGSVFDTELGLADLKRIEERDLGTYLMAIESDDALWARLAVDPLHLGVYLYGKPTQLFPPGSQGHWGFFRVVGLETEANGARRVLLEIGGPNESQTEHLITVRLDLAQVRTHFTALHTLE